MFTFGKMRALASLLALIAACIVYSAEARANPVTFVLQGPAFSSNTPAGSITVLITQFNASTVQFSITNNTDGDIDDLYFNNILAGGPNWATAAGCALCSQISFDSNAFKADGDGLYDMQVMFPSSGGAHGPDRFAPGETVTFTVTAIGIVPESFLSFSSPDGGSGPFQVAAHVISIDSQGGQSGWISDQPIPEPTTLLLLGSGMVGVAAHLRRRFRK